MTMSRKYGHLTHVEKIVIGWRVVSLPKTIDAGDGEKPCTPVIGLGMALGVCIGCVLAHFDTA